MSEGVLTLANGYLIVEIADLGAELVRLRDREGRDYLWNGDPAHWKGRAPLLFPMVGRAAGDVIRVNGAAYPLPQHGFARVSRFIRVEATATRCRMRLQTSEATPASYPFHFRLDVVFELAWMFVAGHGDRQESRPMLFALLLRFSSRVSLASARCARWRAA